MVGLRMPPFRNELSSGPKSCESSPEQWLKSRLSQNSRFQAEFSIKTRCRCIFRPTRGQRAGEKYAGNAEQRHSALESKLYSCIPNSSVELGIQLKVLV